MSKENNITIRKINSFDDFDLIKEDWIKLKKDYDSGNIYADPDFFSKMFATRATDNSKPHIVLFKKNNNAIAIIIGWINPNYITTCWVGYFKLKSPPLVCYEIENNGIITDGREETQNIVCNYLKSKMQKKEIQLFSFNHLSSQNKIWKKLFDENALNKKLVYRKSVNWKTILINKDTGEKNQIHSKRTMKKLNRKGKKFLSSFDNDVEIKIIKNESEIDKFIKEAELITKNSYQFLIDVGVKNNEYWKKALTNLAEGNYFRAYMLYVKGTPVAYCMGALYEKTLFLFATGFNFQYKNYSPGEYLRYQLIDKLADKGIQAIDYGYGDAIYKQRCGTEFLEEASIRVYGKGNLAFLSSKIDNFLIHTCAEFFEKLRYFDFFYEIKALWKQNLIKKSAGY